MLVLTRKARESIMIGDDVEVTVLANDGSKVRLGVSAPANVRVHRTEIWLEIQAEGFESGGGEQPARSGRRRRAR